MFFSVSKILIFFTDPLFYLFLFLLLAIWRFKRRRYAFMLFVAIYILCTPFISQQLLYRLEHLKRPSDVSEKTYDAVVVLSGMLHLSISEPGHLEFSGAVDRILKGVQLIKQDRAKFLVISGGSGSLMQNQYSEAELLKGFVQTLGIGGERILIDPSSRNTYQNAVNTKELLEKYKIERTLLVTSAFHMFRSYGCFKKAGIKADILPVDFRADPEIAGFRSFLPSTGAIYLFNRVLHESIGIAVYGITGKASYL